MQALSESDHSVQPLVKGTVSKENRISMMSGIKQTERDNRKEGRKES